MKGILFFILFIVLAGVGCLNSEPPTNNILKNNSNEIIATKTENYDECLKKVEEQKNYLKNDTIADVETFEKYKVSNAFGDELSDLDTDSNRFARMYRTVIRDQLKDGVNFAGHYSIVSVGMTGSGVNYLIIDRTNGKAYLFPYKGNKLNFRKDSNLIILDSKDSIKKSIEEIEPYGGTCFIYGIGAQGIMYYDLRPFYFLWENNKIKLLGPTNIELPINTFWNINI